MNNEKLQKLIDQAEEFSKKGEFSASVAKWDEIIPLLPDGDERKSTAINQRGIAKHNLGDHKGAIADYDQALEINPQYAAAYNNRGVAKRSTGDHEGAIADFGRAMEINPQDSSLYNNRGNAKDSMGDHKGAIADYDQALEINQQDAEVYCNRGDTKRKMNDHAGAIADLDRAIAINPQLAEAYNNRGATKRKMGDYKGAIADYDRAIEINPNHKNAIHNRAAALALQLSQKGREEIEAQYQAQLQAQQQQFEDNMQAQAKIQQDQFDRKMQEREQELQENFDTQLAEALRSGKSAIKSSDYQDRLNAYSRLFRLHRILVLLGALALAGVAFAIFYYLATFGVQMWQCTQSPMAMSCFSPLSLLPFILMGTLVLTTLAWIVRILNRDKHKYWVLREDALANLTLMQIIESNLKSDIKRKLWLQLFDHHDKRGSARLIADWNHSDTSGNNFTINSGGGGIRP